MKIMIVITLEVMTWAFQYFINSRMSMVTVTILSSYRWLPPPWPLPQQILRRRPGPQGQRRPLRRHPGAIGKEL
jgi:hypothetical protein